MDPGQPTKLSHGGSQCQLQAQEVPGNGFSVTLVLILEKRNLKFYFKCPPSPTKTQLIANSLFMTVLCLHMGHLPSVFLSNFLPSENICEREQKRHSCFRGTDGPVVKAETRLTGTCKDENGRRSTEEGA